MDCYVTYTSPDGVAEINQQISGPISFGRDPINEGVALTPEDQTISSNAFELSTSNNRLVIKNTSSYSQITVQHDMGIRFLDPGEELRTTSSSIISVSGQIYSHTISVNIDGVQETKAASGETINPRPTEIRIADERMPTITAMCASRFFPERYGSKLISASTIAKALSKSGPKVTARAVNHKIQRTKDELSADHDLFLETREDLVDFLIRNGAVTRKMVEDLLH